MKLKYKYPEAELHTAITRLLTLSRTLITNKEYDLEYISNRVGVEIMLCEDVLEYLSIGGFYTHQKNGAWIVLE